MQVAVITLELEHAMTASRECGLVLEARDVWLVVVLAVSAQRLQLGRDKLHICTGRCF